MILFRRCPCCGEEFTFFDYIAQERDINEDINHIKCKKCNKVILLSNRKQPIRNIGLTMMTLCAIYLIINGLFYWFNWILLLIAIVIVEFLNYRFEKLQCYTIEELKNSNLNGDIVAGAVVLFIIFLMAILLFYVLTRG